MITTNAVTVTLDWTRIGNQKSGCLGSFSVRVSWLVVLVVGSKLMEPTSRSTNTHRLVSIRIDAATDRSAGVESVSGPTSADTALSSTVAQSLADTSFAFPPARSELPKPNDPLQIPSPGNQTLWNTYGKPSETIRPVSLSAFFFSFFFLYLFFTRLIFLLSLLFFRTT